MPYHFPLSAVMHQKNDGNALFLHIQALCHKGARADFVPHWYALLCLGLLIFLKLELYLMLSQT
jgi:hypothetical protein